MQVILPQHGPLKEIASYIQIQIKQLTKFHIAASIEDYNLETYGSGMMELQKEGTLNTIYNPNNTGKIYSLLEIKKYKKS